jgi:hypothetical protein
MYWYLGMMDERELYEERLRKAESARRLLAGKNVTKLSSLIKGLLLILS